MVAPAARATPPLFVASMPSPHVLAPGAASPDRFFVLLVLDLGAPTPSPTTTTSPAPPAGSCRLPNHLSSPPASPSASPAPSRYYETDAAAASIDYSVDDPSFLPEQPGKPLPLDHQISHILLSTACIRVV
ncbi:early nodulin-20-like [Triticum dicoccoides]|uniref:early nodulin-20-like n=1 Tax=Triticum dicoccoides TaxID=85692 RepID=UPI00188F7CF6|nr:early nodulin-20-like [Triticum dicoccoides]